MCGRLKRNLLMPLLLCVLTMPAWAPPRILPNPPVAFTGTIKEIVEIQSPEPVMVVVTIKDYEGLDQETARKLHLALKRETRYRVKNPTRQSVEVVFKKSTLKDLKAGDRVRVSDYCVVGHDTMSGCVLSDRAGIQKAAR